MSPPEHHFGKYVLVDRIAAGGMAELFLARYSPAPGVTKQVVIKKILPHYAANKAFIGMFTNEARIAMGLSHGNIAQVFDFGSIEGDYFLAMEFVDGQPLSKLLKRAEGFGLQGLPPQLATYVVAEALKGLHYAHTRLDEQGRPLHIVHRDVSPQNLLVSYEAQVKVVDFGIARARNATVEDTSSNALKGKYVYFSPEQARGKELDARADIFAAGVVLYEALTGQLPFQGKMMDALSRIVRGQFKRPRELNRRIGVELERIVLRAMALDRNERYPTAEAFAQDLTRSLVQSHPDFQPTQLGLLLQLLFEEELVKAGRPVQLPRAFLERAQEWKRPLRRDDAAEPEADAPEVEPAEAPTEMVDLEEGGPPPQRAPRVTAEPRRTGRAGRGPSMRMVMLTAAALAVSGLALLLALGMRHATLEVDSRPSGATVTLDGRLLDGVTPMTISGLEGNRAFRLELSLPGHARWKNDVPLKPGQQMVVSAHLELEVDSAARSPALDPTSEAAAPVPDRVTWPVRAVTMDLARHHLDLGQAGATGLTLEPNQTYRVSLSRGPSLGWAFYVVNDVGATPVAFADQPLEIKGASTLFAFQLPLHGLGAKGPEETQARVLTVQAFGQRKTVYPVWPKLTVVEPTRVVLEGLSPANAYDLTPHHGSPPARLRDDGPPLRRLVIGTRAGLQVIAFDEVTRIEGVDAVFFTVVEDGARPSGRVEIEVREVPRRRPRR